MCDNIFAAHISCTLLSSLSGIKILHFAWFRSPLLPREYTGPLLNSSQTPHRYQNFQNSRNTYQFLVVTIGKHRNALYTWGPSSGAITPKKRRLCQKNSDKIDFKTRDNVDFCLLNFWTRIDWRAKAAKFQNTILFQPVKKQNNRVAIARFCIIYEISEISLLETM